MSDKTQEEFESHFGPMPANCIWAGNGYASTTYHNWIAGDYAEKFKGWQAATKRSAARIAELEQQTAGALALVADVRMACGDNGKRMQPELMEYLRGLVADAERYRWLAAKCRSTPEHWGGRWSIVVEGPAPKSQNSEDDFDSAIDAARGKACP